MGSLDDGLSHLSPHSLTPSAETGCRWKPVPGACFLQQTRRRERVIRTESFDKKEKAAGGATCISFSLSAAASAVVLAIKEGTIGCLRSGSRVAPPLSRFPSTFLATGCADRTGCRRGGGHGSMEVAVISASSCAQDCRSIRTPCTVFGSISQRALKGRCSSAPLQGRLRPLLLLLLQPPCRHLDPRVTCMPALTFPDSC